MRSRAWKRLPNRIKAVAPKTAARIREHVDATSNVNPVIRFDRASGAGPRSVVSTIADVADRGAPGFTNAGTVVSSARESCRHVSE